MAQTTDALPVDEIINQNWLLLDTYSIISSINNENLVKETHACDSGEEIQVYTNGGNQNYNYTTTMTVLHFNFFFKNPLANIILFAAVARRFNITIDINIDSVINENLDDGTSIKSNSFSRGLY